VCRPKTCSSASLAFLPSGRISGSRSVVTVRSIRATADILAPNKSLWPRGSRGGAAFGYALQAASFRLVCDHPGHGRRQTLPTRSMERTVASVCDICGKRPGFGNNVSHSHVRTRRRWNPNIQTVRAVVSGTPKRLNVCTSCIKAGKVRRH